MIIIINKCIIIIINSVIWKLITKYLKDLTTERKRVGTGASFFSYIHQMRSFFSPEPLLCKISPLLKKKICIQTPRNLIIHVNEALRKTAAREPPMFWVISVLTPTTWIILTLSFLFSFYYYKFYKYFVLICNLPINSLHIH